MPPTDLFIILFSNLRLLDKYINLSSLILMNSRILTYCNIFLKSEVLKLSAMLDIWQMQESIKNLVCGSYPQS